MSQTIEKIYLHWSATSYNWKEPGHYHTIILGDGTVEKPTNYFTPLPEHTYARNDDSASVCMACMGGKNPWKQFPPREEQIESMCKEVARLASKLEWEAKDITIKRIMTHAEAAANKDYPKEDAKKVSGWSAPDSKAMERIYLAKARRYGLPHENYGPSSWHDGWPGGFVDRWDLWQLKKSDKGGVGGDIVREKIKDYLDAGALKHEYKKCKIQLNSKDLTEGYIIENRCYVYLSELAKSIGINVNWNSKYSYVNLITDKFKVQYLPDSPTPEGYKEVCVYLNHEEETSSEQEYPFMKGILVEGKSYVLVGDFCEELGIVYTYNSSDKSINVTIK